MTARVPVLFSVTRMMEVIVIGVFMLCSFDMCVRDCQCGMVNNFSDLFGCFDNLSATTTASSDEDIGVFLVWCVGILLLVEGHDVVYIDVDLTFVLDAR